MIAEKMELDSYIEKDIIEFLDETAKLNTANYTDLVKDYKEFLKLHNISKALKLLKEIIKEYNQLTEKDIYKDITLNKIQEMTKLSQVYLDRTTWNNELGRVIKEINNQNPFESRDNITVFSDHERDKAYKEKEKLKELYLSKNELDLKFDKLNKEIFVAIKKKDFKLAVKIYREIKEIFNSYPGVFEEEKQDKYNDLLAHFIQLKKLKSELKSKPKNNHKDLDLSLENKHHLKINYIKETIKKIKEEVQSNNFTSARTRLIELREKVEKIPQSYGSIKKIMTNKLNIINQNIELARRYAEHKKVNK